MLETTMEWNQEVVDGAIEKERAFTLSPGIRHVFNFTDAQLVLGVGAPVTFKPERTEYGVLFYLSYEHKFLKRARMPGSHQRLVLGT